MFKYLTLAMFLCLNNAFACPVICEDAEDMNCMARKDICDLQEKQRKLEELNQRMEQLEQQMQQQQRQQQEQQ